MKSFFNYSKNRILYSLFRFLLFVAFGFLIGSLKVDAAIIQNNRSFYYTTNSDSDYITSSFVNGNSYFTLPNNSRISAWWVDFNGSSFSLISGQTYTGYLYFDINNTTYAWVENGTNLYMSVNCAHDPNSTSTCTNYLKSYTNASIVSGMILIEFDFIAPNLQEDDIVYLGLNNASSNKYALAYSSGNTIKVAFNKLSYDLSSGGISSGEQIIIDGQDKLKEEQKKTNTKLDEAENTRKSIWQTIKDLPNKFLDMLKGLFIPEDMSFIDNLKESLENKLGFIASVPLQVIDYPISYRALSRKRLREARGRGYRKIRFRRVWACLS